eukprot:CAMPEP_0173149902 /NCGR_PEP_ID=MMETSP1105-20130129/10615_1 /TAXON_ID=2985 /ORGANISM="Ochromonas sp., Strain BG-1" /LENGTH=214 /DNA_ID=CAMNT_0014064883 /DNA_START=72 /DNA_END=717 /DNA_ORIENTATION=-
MTQGFSIIPIDCRCNLVIALKKAAAFNLAMIDKRACFGAGCYWGTEKYFKNDFGKKTFPGSGAVKNGKVGFMGPPTAKRAPTYKEVCTGTTQQVEVYDFEYEGDETTYENLVKHFFMFHDPTVLNAQEQDIGTQYASVIYVYDQKQKEIATKVKSEVQKLLNENKITTYRGKTVTTAINDATEFFPAHEEHQEYLDKNPGGYCNHRYRIKSWPN